MSMLAVVFLSLVFGAVLLGMLALFTATAPQEMAARLGSPAVVTPQSGGGERRNTPWAITISRITTPFSRLSLPSGQWEDSALRIHFMHAGYRAASAPTAFFAVKSVLTFLLPGIALVLVYGSHIALHGLPLTTVVILLAAIGYFAPNVLLSQRIAARQAGIFEAFPDALDLMTICVEAGLGLDAAIARVAKQIGMESSVLAEEMHLVELELRAGSSRDRALRNLAVRTGVEEIEALVAMLVQADRFGTSVADSLRVHADTLREKRRQRAEERAAKVATKLLFPLIFCVFPSMMLVLLGPAFIAIHRTLLPTLGSN